jgi:hypothetical protein
MPLSRGAGTVVEKVSTTRHDASKSAWTPTYCAPRAAPSPPMCPGPLLIRYFQPRSERSPSAWTRVGHAVHCGYLRGNSFKQRI